MPIVHSRSQTPPPVRLFKRERREECRAAFAEYLSKHERTELFMAKGGIPALQAAIAIDNRLRNNLGENFLGVTLGGSLSHGLGLAAPAPLACRIYLRDINGAFLPDLGKQVSAFLAGRQFKPPTHLVSDLAARPFADAKLALAPFTDRVVHPADETALRHAALAAIADAAERTDLEELKKEFRKLTGCDAGDLVGKFILNWEPLVPTKRPLLRDDQSFLAELVVSAREPLARRALRFPFPRVIETLFK